MQPQTVAEAQKAAPAPNRYPAIPLQRIEQVSTTYWAFIPVGHTPEDVLDPKYWVHQAKRIRQNSMIVVRAEDGSFDGQLLVIQASDTWLKCAWFVLNRRDEAEKAEVDYSPRRDRYKLEASAKGWRVIDKESGAILAKELAQKSDAEKFLDSYLAEMKN